MTSCSLCASAAFESQPCKQRQREHEGEWAGGAESHCAGADDDDDEGGAGLESRSEESERGSPREATVESKESAEAAATDSG
jgi:hypothetical protein